MTGGESSADGAARAREGYLFFKKRYPSLTPSQRKFALAVLISKECGACGTAAVISPIGYIYDMQTEKSYDYGDEVGKNCMELYTRLQDIQYGRAEDKYDWCTVVL